MKRNKKIPKENPRVKRTVRLQFVHPSATAVSIAGSFNDWRPGATQMVPVGHGRWLKDLVLPPGTYEYRLIVDGQWTTDPLAAGAATNPFGGANSVLRVPQPPDGH